MIHLISQISVDERILGHMIETKADFIMEVTDKTRADIQVCRGARHHVYRRSDAVEL